MLLAATILYTLAAILRIWMATTMRSPAERNPQQLSMISLKNSLKTMVTILLGGGVVTWIFLTDGVRDIAFRLSGELEPLYLGQVGGISIQQIGVLGSIFSISMMFTPILSGRISDKYGERVPISSGFLFMFFAYMIFLNASTFLGFGLTWMIFGIGVGLLSPAYQSIISKVIPQSSLGIFTGLFRGSLGFISLPAPWVGAQLWERFNPRLPFIITAIVSLITVIPTQKKQRKSPNLIWVS
jgi:MFS family permease